MATKTTEPTFTNALPSASVSARKAAGIDAVCEFSAQMLRNLERATEHEDMTEDLAELLSTANVTVEYRVETGLETD